MNNNNKVTLFHLLSATAANQNNKAKNNHTTTNLGEEEVAILPYHEDNTPIQDFNTLEESPSVAALFEESPIDLVEELPKYETENEGQSTWKNSRVNANMRVFASNETTMPVPFEAPIVDTVEQDIIADELIVDGDVLDFVDSEQIDTGFSDVPEVILEEPPKFEIGTTEEESNPTDIEYLDEADSFDIQNIDEAYRQRLMALGLAPIETTETEVITATENIITDNEQANSAEDIDEALSQVFANSDTLPIEVTGESSPDVATASINTTAEPPTPEHFSPLDFHLDGETSGVNASSDNNKISESTDSKTSMLKQFRQLQDRNSTFVFMFGRQQAGKTVLLSSLAYHLGTDEEGLLETRRRADNLKGAAYLKQLSESVRKGQFMNRTAVGSLYELDLTYTPNKPEIPMNFTFLEMSGEDLTKVELSETTAGELPSDIEVYLKCPNLNVVFMLVVPYEDAEEHDYLVIDFLDYLKERKPDFDYSKLLLLISKWDRYEGLRKDAVDLFVKEQMPRTYSRLKAKKATLARYSIGEVSENNEEILELNQERPAVVKRWLYQAATGQKIKDESSSFWNKIKQWV